MMGKLLLSVAIITNNEEDNLGRTLDSISDLASEIIIVDSHSTDKTQEIAESYHAKFFVEDWKGYAGQKNSALEKCTNDWILCLDADEVVSEELKQSIIDAINSDSINGFVVNRKTVYLGKLLNHAWQPDKNLRLVKSSSNPVWVGDVVHESLQVQGNIGELSGTLLHYSYKNISHHIRKTIDYAKASADDYYNKGKRFHVYNLLLNPVIAFKRLYFFNLGFLDGFRGFIAAFSSFVYTFLKYLFLWEKQNKD